MKTTGQLMIPFICLLQHAGDKNNMMVGCEIPKDYKKI